MRSIEAIHCLASLGYFVLFYSGLYQPLHNAALILILLLIPLSHYYEGIRLIQLPYMFGIVIHLLALTLPGMWPYFISLVTCLLLLVSIILHLHLGHSDLSHVTLSDAPYLVGHREIRSVTLSQEISVYYPVDRNPENERLLRRNESLWLRKGDKTLKGMARASVPYGREDHPNIRWFRWLKRVKMGTIERVGEIANAFVSGTHRLSG